MKMAGTGEAYYRAAHEAACAAGSETYVDSVTGLTVFYADRAREKGKVPGAAAATARSSLRERRRSGRPRRQRRAGAGRVDTPSSELMRKNRVYTKSATRESSLFTGERVSKDNAVFEALGTIDELVSFCGVAHASWLGNGLHAT